MNRRLVLRSRVEADVTEIASWYEHRGTKLAVRFLDAFDDAIDRLAADPLAYAIVEDAVRRVLMKRFPYHVYFVVEETQITVLGVYHAARHPDRWRERL